MQRGVFVCGIKELQSVGSGWRTMVLWRSSWSNPQLKIRWRAAGDSWSHTRLMLLIGLRKSDAIDKTKKEQCHWSKRWVKMGNSSKTRDWNLQNKGHLWVFSTWTLKDHPSALDSNLALLLSYRQHGGPLKLVNCRDSVSVCLFLPGVLAKKRLFLL